MSELLSNIDLQLFHWINSGLKNSFFDFIMPLLREKSNWIPFYAILFLFVFRNFSKEKSIAIILAAILTVGISDTLSSKVIKPIIERPRPCHIMEKEINLLIHCGGGYSFTSSHATNHFAIGTFLGLVFFPFIKKRSLILFWIWAGIISFAQIYVGVHYPFDILCGGILGILIGGSVYRLMNYSLEKYLKKKKKERV